MINSGKQSSVWNSLSFGMEFTLLCGWRFKTVIKHAVPKRFSSNSEAYASELLENINEIFSRY